MRPDRRSRPAVALVAAALAVVLVLSAVAAPVAGAAKAPKRVVALTPFTANVLIGLGKTPVGVGQTLGGEDRLSSKLARVKELPLAHPNGPNMEQLASVRPQLVFSSPTWAKGNSIIEDLDVDVEIAEPRRVSDVGGATRRVGALVDRRKQARTLAARYEKRISKATAGVPRDRPKVLMVLGVGRTPFVFLPNSWGGDIVRRAGADLLTADASARGGFARISDEVILAENPDIIIAVPHGDPDDLDDLADYLKSNPAWEFTSAAQNDRVYVSADDSLLQPGTDVASTIKRVRTKFLDNM